MEQRTGADAAGVPAEAEQAARAALAVLRRRSASLAVAESLTGGLIGAAVTAVPGASESFRGGIISYATELKAGLLGVDAALLARSGAVHPEVAVAMARGVRDRLAADFGLAVTGVAGPDPQDGRPVGTVFVGLAGPGGVTRMNGLDIVGDRAGIRAQTVVRALRFLHSAVDSYPNRGEQLR
ncbi:CinA family protein [Allonocardiopsis opalescens]|uniref:Competence/damage-inducible protein cinA n=1 Tax=Allonocardiopsis opalescens TaxID=1144618 RepID=A0A2T0QFE1_9ACTN|nr:nicotinamide-nucleotide amidohydrolase family protein [Allonocardiopsis opalescens]PRY02632.1 competence/damage-inducible protein cinA [Allonocardiopsis opalescens]